MIQEIFTPLQDAYELLLIASHLELEVLYRFSLIRLLAIENYKVAMKSGILRIDAPKLFRELQRRLAGQSLIEIEQLYKKLGELGCLNDQPIKREKGVSFNPRPARICQILISEVHEDKFNMFAAAHLMCANPDITIEGYKDAQLIVDQARSLLTIQSPSLMREFSMLSERIALAWRLDELRHIHMSEIDSAKIEDLVCSTNNLLNSVDQIKNKRLIVLITTVLRRYQNA